MSEHEELHEQREREADELEQENERLGNEIEAAKDANQRLESDQLIATPDDDRGEEPPAEAEYPAKD
jgi:hypothetical protein